MKVPRSQIAPVLADLIRKPGRSAERLGREIAAYLLDENRTGELDSLLRDVVAHRAKDGIVEVTAVSAHELSGEVRRDIEKLVRERFENVEDIIIDQRIDTDVVGGVRLELIDEQLDLTVRGTLNRFRALTTVERTART